MIDFLLFAIVFGLVYYFQSDKNPELIRRAFAFSIASIVWFIKYSCF